MARSIGGRPRKKMILWLGAALVVVVPVWIGLRVWSGSGGPVPGDPFDAAQVSLGRQVYAEACASCHGANLAGQPNWRVRDADGYLPGPPHDETGHTWHHPDRQLFQITKNGVAASAPAGYKTTMIAFADQLSDEEIWAVLAFIKSRWPASIRQRQEKVTARDTR